MMRRALTLAACSCMFVSVFIRPSAMVAQEPVAGYCWIEGEQPASCNVTPTLNGWGNANYLSDEKWLSLSIPSKEIAATVPAEGVLLKYDAMVAESGQYHVWARIGFEFVRAPFQWRIDGGPWTIVTPDELTTDLMEIVEWCEVAWIKLGEADLRQGKHVVEFRLQKTTDKKGQPARILFALDAVCISKGAFAPNGPHKPDEDGRDARDRAAAKTVFDVPEPKTNAARSEVPLAGRWEICRHDEQLPGAIAEPIQDMPKHPHWRAIDVPGDKNTLRPDLKFAHRLWYRTRIRVPASAMGHSFHIVFPENNLNTTVVVNGVCCGFNKNPFARFQIDITPGLQPGINELWVGIRDAWYGYSTNPNDPLKLRKKFNLPIKYFDQGFQDLAYPIWRHPQSGILVTPVLVMAGSAYVSDVFCKPSVKPSALAVETTVKNTNRHDVSVTLTCAAVDDLSGKTEKTFAPRQLTLPAGAEQTLEVKEEWANPKLWWPDDPHMYRLRTTLQIDGKLIDVSETPFGFRQWTLDGKDFKLNGIVWHGWADCFRATTPEQWIEFYHKTHQRTTRFWGTRWQGLPPDEALQFFDEHGVVVRRSGILDGEAIGYMAVEQDPDLKKVSEIKMDLMHNWRDQMVAQAKGERNHPSIMIWSLENEFLYINCINLYGRLMDQFEAETAKTAAAVAAVDPTRPTMVDGGGACKNNALPVQGDHYVFKDFPKYPDLAYEANPDGGGRGRWQWDQQRPRFIGEDYFANGINPFDYSYFGGEETFQGKAESRRAAGIIYRILMEGYRWAGYGAWQFWMSQDEAVNQYGANSPRAVFCRQWDWTFGSDQKVSRSLRVFNDTRYDAPITFSWSLTFDGRPVQEGHQLCHVTPGGSQPLEITLSMPAVAQRTEGRLEFKLTVGGQTVFQDAKEVSVLDNRDACATAAGRLSKTDLLVYDPHGSIIKFLELHAIPFTRLENLSSIPDRGRVLIIGNDAVAATECDASKFQAYAAAGRRVIVLEQQYPLRYQALPADMRAADNEGRTAFVEDLNHPVFRGLKQKDFFTWSGDHIVYRNAYFKPTRGGKSLVQCHDRLQNTAMTEMPVGSGLMLVSQLRIGEKLQTSAAAQQLFANMINYAATYKLEHRPVRVCTRDLDPQLAATLDAIELQYSTSAEPTKVLDSSRPTIAIVSASAGNLQQLVTNLERVRQFTHSGGQIVLHGLTPDGLASFNQIVGFQHMIRPFTRERVAFPPVRNPLTAGLTLGDVVMRSGERIFGWTRDEYVASDTYSYVVDFDDVAPFAKFPDDFARNMVNGMVTADAWKYIVNVPAPDKPPLDWELEFSKPQELVGFTWTGNTIYYPVTKVQLIFDGKAERTATFDTEPTNAPQVFSINPPIRGSRLTLRLADWQVLREKRQVTGLNNIALKARRSPEFYQRVRPLLNVGAMMQYVDRTGGIILCNLRFLQHESVPENELKKKRILSTILRNLKAPFVEGKTIVAGAKMQYHPLDIAKSCNQFRDERGWFGDKSFTFATLPTGRQTFAGVPFQVYDFPTSPVPTVVMLGGRRVPNKLAEEVRGIPIQQKADALFFLHTARIDRRRSPRDLKENKQFELCRYVVTYVDGTTCDIPVIGEVDVEDYRQKVPRVIPGSQLAWVRPYEGTEYSAVAYVKQWNNPRPDVEIKSMALVYGQERRGVPCLIAVTAARADQ